MLSRGIKAARVNFVRCFSTKNGDFDGWDYMTDHVPFYESPLKPNNFTDVIDLKGKFDNFLDEARAFNEKESHLKRAQFYLCFSTHNMFYIYIAKYLASSWAGMMAGFIRYFPDKYTELDIGELPPGETMQSSWHGAPLFIRRLTEEEMKDEQSVPDHELIQPGAKVNITEAPNSHVLVVSAKCTHLGCIPVPYVGKKKGWTCMCHGSVFDKWGRVIQGPALENLKYQNHSLYGNILCIDNLKFDYQPKRLFLVQ